ncbi:hypothetical protein ONZ45_g16382 [Pleurotus djamor]|nr:hypothetical protein ONZ45_g16382 [Pleurotus djamor]
MLMFNASTISLTQRAAAPPPSPELSPLCERIASLRRGTLPPSRIPRWLSVRRIQSVVARIQAVRFRRNKETRGPDVQYDVKPTSFVGPPSEVLSVMGARLSSPSYEKEEKEEPFVRGAGGLLADVVC